MVEQVLKNKILYKMPEYICGACNGAGRIHCIGDLTCSGCAGTGRDLHSDLMAMPCNKCNGRGKITTTYYERCGRCSGSGKIRY